MTLASYFLTKIKVKILRLPQHRGGKMPEAIAAKNAVELNMIVTDEKVSYRRSLLFRKQL